MTTVIVIDDDQDIVLAMSELLEANGMKVIGKGYNGLEGVQLFEKLQPDLVLLDMRMPKYDGLYALRKIREKDKFANVVIVTGGYPDSIEEELQSLKPTKILFKPINVNNIVKLFLKESDNSLAFKIKYKFKEDSKQYTCTLTYEQYKNFRALPIIEECEIIKKYEENLENYKNEMQEALKLAVKKDTSHIRKLSKIVS